MRRGSGGPLISYAAREDGRAKQVMIRLVERLNGRNQIVRAYRKARRVLDEDDDVWAVAVHYLDLTVLYDAGRLRRFPGAGHSWSSRITRSASSTVSSSAT